MLDALKIKDDYSKVSKGNVSVDELRQIALFYISQCKPLYFRAKDAESKVEKIKIYLNGVEEMNKMIHKELED